MNESHISSQRLDLNPCPIHDKYSNIYDNMLFIDDDKSQEGFFTSLALGVLVFYLICVLISMPFAIASKIKNKKLLKKAEEMLSKMSESEKREIKNFIDTVLSTQKLIQDRSSKKIREIVVKNVKAVGLKTYDHKTNITCDTEIIKDDSEKSIKNLYKEIVKVLSNNTSLDSNYIVDECFVIKDYYKHTHDDKFDSMLDTYNKFFDNVSKDVKNNVLSSVPIDKSKFSLNIDEVTTGESCPGGTGEHDGFKALCVELNLTVNKRYINKVFKPLFDRCKNDK